MKQENILHKNGIPLTLPRSLVLKVIESYKSRHFSAEDILATLRKQRLTVSRATVFRTLKLFAEKNILDATDVGKGFKLYELSGSSGHHDHLYCVSCGKIIEFKDSKIEKLQDNVCKREKFMPVSHTLRISGICEICKKKD